MDAHSTIRVDDFTYLTVGGVSLGATLYRPQGSGFPGVVDVHGGRWVANDRFTNAKIAEHLARDGIAVLSIDFRMPPEASYPASIEDIHFAIRWFKANAERLGVRPEAVGGLGTSSGGHQMLLTAMKPLAAPYGTHPLDANVDATLPYMVVGWPVADPIARFEYAKNKGRDDLIEAHDQFWVPLSTMEEGNPQRLLDTKTYDSLPPALILQGSADDNFDYRMNEHFADCYRKAGGEAEFVLYEGEGHSFMVRNHLTEASQDGLERICRFIHAHTVP